MRSRIPGLLLTLLLATLALWVTGLPASANSAPPPSVVWFYFDLPVQPTAGGALPFDGLQLVGCADAACAEPVLLQQAGRCEVAGCLGGPPLPPQSGPAEWSRLECFGDRCRSQSYTYPTPYFRLALQPPGGGALLLSEVEKLPESFAQRQFWRVTVAGDYLALAVTEEMETPNAINQPFWAHYLLTLGVELLVAGLVWLAVLRNRLPLPRLLLMVGLATSLTYPAVYLSPAVAPFAQSSERTLFYTALLAGAATAGLVWMLFALALWPGAVEGHAALSKGRRWALGISVTVLLLACLVACPLYIMSVSYGSYALDAAGISPFAAIGLAELYAFVLETLCYRLWSRGAVNWGWALLLSLLANLASLGLGLLLF